jgi:hypothetical protein
MLIGPVRYILATERLQGPVFTALPGCRATALPLKREVAPTLVVARLMAATSVGERLAKTMLDREPYLIRLVYHVRQSRVQ